MYGGAHPATKRLILTRSEMRAAMGFLDGIGWRTPLRTREDEDAGEE
jgi:hypothetical protein